MCVTLAVDCMCDVIRDAPLYVERELTKNQPAALDDQENRAL